MTKEATKEFKIGLAEFEELAKEFISKQSGLKDELWTTDEEQSGFWIDAFKEFIFSEELDKQKRKQEYFKLKEQLGSMKQEFEPDEAGIYYTTKQGALCKAVEDAGRGCFECILDETEDCQASWGVHDCNFENIIWIKK